MDSNLESGAFWLGRRRICVISFVRCDVRFCDCFTTVLATLEYISNSAVLFDIWNLFIRGYIGIRDADGGIPLEELEFFAFQSLRREICPDEDIRLSGQLMEARRQRTETLLVEE